MQGRVSEQLLWRTAADVGRKVRARQRASEGSSGGHCFSAQNDTLLLSINASGMIFWVEHHV